MQLPEESPLAAEGRITCINSREWLVTNGLGGYASGLVAGGCSRKYHGLLIAALPAPLGRSILFNELREFTPLAEEQSKPASDYAAQSCTGLSPLAVTSFELDRGLPAWTFRVSNSVLEKRVLLPHLQNTVVLQYRLQSGNSVPLILCPDFHFRPHEQAVHVADFSTYQLLVMQDRVEVLHNGWPPLRMRHVGESGEFRLHGGQLRTIHYTMEASRGYESSGAHWSPGAFVAQLTADRDITLIASTEAWETVLALDARQCFAAEYQRRQQLLSQARIDTANPLDAQLVLAADQFIVRPSTRVTDAARAHAAGDEPCSIIAGYHWFTDWGRDTMISLEGLTLLTGRHLEAGSILRTFARHARHGLIPNYFPEGEQQGVYHTADASLWYFHALQRYLQATDDRGTLEWLLPTLKDIVAHHERGTNFGIGTDPRDGLLRQGAEGYQLTWMDAKVGDWVVTPRRGKAVEINALWYNALCLLTRWCDDTGDSAEAERLTALAQSVKDSFNAKFWNPSTGCLFDVLGEDNLRNDAAIRPNQLLAISLDYPVLHPSRWRTVLDRVQAQLLTPFGLRSLSPDHAAYQQRYEGDLRARDAAYHQGTVWAWLIGPFIDAWLRVYPDRQTEARMFLHAFGEHLHQAGNGSISEIFDAEPPFEPRGCIAQAWSVAEVLRGRYLTQATATCNQGTPTAAEPIETHSR